MRKSRESFEMSWDWEVIQEYDENLTKQECCEALAIIWENWDNNQTFNDMVENAIEQILMERKT